MPAESPFGPAVTAWFDALDGQDVPVLRFGFVTNRYVPLLTKNERAMLAAELKPAQPMQELFMRLFANRGLPIDVAARHYNWLVDYVSIKDKP